MAAAGRLRKWLDRVMAYTPEANNKMDHIDEQARVQVTPLQGAV
jgi:hypothetical protein